MIGFLCRRAAAVIAIYSVGWAAQAAPVPDPMQFPLTIGTGGSAYIDQSDDRDYDDSYAMIHGPFYSPTGSPDGWRDGSRMTLEITTDGAQIETSYLTMFGDVMFEYWYYWVDDSSSETEWFLDEAWTTASDTPECDLKSDCVRNGFLHDFVVTDTSVIFTIDTPVYAFGCYGDGPGNGSGDCWEQIYDPRSWKIELWADTAFSYEVRLLSSEIIPYEGPVFPYYAVAAAEVAPVPIPAGFGLLLGALGLTGLGFGRRRAPAPR